MDFCQTSIGLVSYTTADMMAYREVRTPWLILMDKYKCFFTELGKRQPKGFFKNFQPETSL